MGAVGEVAVAVGKLPVVAPVTPSRGGGRRKEGEKEKEGFGADYGQEEDEEVV